MKVQLEVNLSPRLIFLLIADYLATRNEVESITKLNFKYSAKDALLLFGLDQEFTTAKEFLAKKEHWHETARHYRKWFKEEDQSIIEEMYEIVQEDITID